MAGAGYKLFNTGDVLTAAQVNTYLQEQVVMVFANAAARTTALSGVLAEGMVSFLKDTDSFEIYSGSAWVAYGSGDITGVTAGTGISGGGTSGTVTITNSMATEITAAGDIIVGTGSGTFDNLPIGTTGQVLTADTTVSPYKVKWATAGGGGSMVLITRTAFSNVASQNFDSVFSSTYKTYFISVESVYGANAGDDLLIGLRYGTTNATGHYGSQNKMPWNSSTIGQTGTNNASAWTIADIIGDATTPTTFHFFASNIGQGASYPGIRGQGFMTYDNLSFIFGGGSVANQSYTGFRVLSSSGNIYGTVAVYGIKDA
jgi:hypothetical protein